MVISTLRDFKENLRDGFGILTKEDFTEAGIEYRGRRYEGERGKEASLSMVKDSTF